MRYPKVDNRQARDRNGNRYMGSYMKGPDGVWKRPGWINLEDLLYFTLDDEYREIHKPHPFLSLLKRPN